MDTVQRIFPSDACREPQKFFVALRARPHTVPCRLVLLKVLAAGVVQPAPDDGHRQRAGVALGAVGLLCLAVLVIDGVNGASLPVGLVERGAVYPIIAWELLAGVTILRTRSVV